MPPRPRVLPPPPRPVLSPSLAAAKVADAPANYPGSGTQAGPRKETARITILPQPATPMASTIKMAKTQPLLTVPVPQPQSAPVVVTPESGVETSGGSLQMLDAVPLPVCWTIFGISTVTLLIQIWNYFSA